MFDCENKISVTEVFLFSEQFLTNFPLDFKGRIKIESEAVHVQTLLAEMEHRARRNRIPNEHRERIVRAFEDPHGLPFGGRHVRGEPQHS